MSDKDDGTGGLILLGLGIGILVLGAISASSQKTIPEATKQKKVPLPDIKPRKPTSAHIFRCSQRGCTRTDARPCHFCGRLVCESHTEGCACTGPTDPWTCGCHKNSASYCGSCD